MTRGKDEIPDPVPPGTILHMIRGNGHGVSGVQHPDPGNPEGLLGRTVHAAVPARIHLSVLDMTRFSPGRPGGGGLGYAIGMYAHARVKIRDIYPRRAAPRESVDGPPELRVDARRPSLVEHITRVFLGHLGLSGSLEVTAEGHELNHMGLGSTSALVTAVALALNRALGDPYTSHEVRAIIGYNFVEEWKDGLVIPGFETGVGPFVGVHGGFGVLSDRLRPVSRFPLPRDHGVVIALIEEEMSDTLVESRNAGISETELLMNRARALDERDGPGKAYEVLMRLIPAGEAGDMTGVGQSVRHLQRMGSKVAEIEHHLRAADIYETMEIMLDNGAVMAGMSSVGPAIAALVPAPGGSGGSEGPEGSGGSRTWPADAGEPSWSRAPGISEPANGDDPLTPAHELADLIRERGYRVLVTRPDNHGALITETD